MVLLLFGYMWCLWILWLDVVGLELLEFVVVVVFDNVVNMVVVVEVGIGVVFVCGLLVVDVL